MMLARCRRYLLPVFLLMSSALAVAATGVAQLRQFEGAWFSVAYPAHFQAQPSLPSYSGPGVDSVFFHAPDGHVSFYLYAPQWGGEPEDIALNPASEVLVSKDRRPSGRQIITWFTIADRQGRYQRSYQRIEQPDSGAVWVVGIRYRSAQDLARYRADYTQFKQSIRLYAD